MVSDRVHLSVRYMRTPRATLKRCCIRTVHAKLRTEALCFVHRGVREAPAIVSYNAPCCSDGVYCFARWLLQARVRRSLRQSAAPAAHLARSKEGEAGRGTVSSSLLQHECTVVSYYAPSLRSHPPSRFSQWKRVFVHRPKTLKSSNAK